MCSACPSPIPNTILADSFYLCDDNVVLRCSFSVFVLCHQLSYQVEYDQLYVWACHPREKLALGLLTFCGDTSFFLWQQRGLPSLFSSILHYVSKCRQRKVTELGRRVNWAHVYRSIICRMKKWVKNSILYHFLGPKYYLIFVPILWNFCKLWFQIKYLGL